jgi:hypothetical protein
LECHDAQDVISQTLDGSPPDAATLEAAKQHCRECSDCAGFVRALTLVKRAPLPEPPAGLTERVMTAVRREAAVELARSEGAASAATAVSGGTPPVAGAADSTEAAATMPSDPQSEAELASVLLQHAGRRRPSRAALAAWVGAAAVLLVGIGAAGVMGVRVMTQGGQPAASSTAVIGRVETPSDAETASEAAPPAADNVASSATKGVSISAGPNYVVYKGVAYRLVGPSTLEKGQLTLLGTTTTSFDGGAMRARDVKGATGIPGVYMEDDTGELMEFQPVERVFEGRTYQLHSAVLAAFGIWPALPAGIATPSSANGSPTFTAAGADASGVTIYRRTSSTVTEGIAVAPGAPSGDPANGNPNWTWWMLAAP